jgi:hypothetical protein
MGTVVIIVIALAIVIGALICAVNSVRLLSGALLSMCRLDAHWSTHLFNWISAFFIGTCIYQLLFWPRPTYQRPANTVFSPPLALDSPYIHGSEHLLLLVLFTAFFLFLFAGFLARLCSRGSRLVLGCGNHLTDTEYLCAQPQANQRAVERACSTWVRGLWFTAGTVVFGLLIREGVNIVSLMGALLGEMH